MNLTQEQIDRIEATPYEDMVSALAKPGADILADMTQSKFNALAYTFDHVLMETENLDLVKKSGYLQQGPRYGARRHGRRAR